jgi:hypothetical protein
MSRDSGGETNVLMVTTTVRVIDGIHRNTSHLGPAVTLDAVLVELITGLEDRLIDSTTTSDQTNSSSALGRDGLTSTRRESDTGLKTVVRVTHDDGRATRSLSKHTTIAMVVLDGRDDGTLGHPVERKNVANSKLSVLAAVDELTSVKSLNSNEQVLDVSVVVRVTEDNLSERSTSARIVHNVSDQTLHVTVTLGVVEGSKLGSSKTTSTDGLEDERLTLTLCTKYSSHFTRLDRLFFAEISPTLWFCSTTTTKRLLLRLT